MNGKCKNCKYYYDCVCTNSNSDHISDFMDAEDWCREFTSAMTLEEAKRILHPDTTADALAEITFYAGFSAEEAKLRAVTDACLVACDAIDKLINLEKWMDDMK